MDPLVPFVETIISTRDNTSFPDPLEKARQGAESTRGMKAKLGRAVYVQEKEGVPPDPGAWGVVAILQGLYDGYYSGGENAE